MTNGQQVPHCSLDEVKSPTLRHSSGIEITAKKLFLHKNRSRLHNPGTLPTDKIETVTENENGAAAIEIKEHQIEAAAVEKHPLTGSKAQLNIEEIEKRNRHKQLESPFSTLHRQSTEERNRKGKIKTSITCGIVALVVVLTWLPLAVLKLQSVQKDYSIQYKDELWGIAIVIFSASSALNPFIYVIMSRSLQKYIGCGNSCSRGGGIIVSSSNNTYRNKNRLSRHLLGDATPYLISLRELKKPINSPIIVRNKKGQLCRQNATTNLQH